MQHKRIILIGPAGSGKDFIKRKFKNKGWKADVSYTTRPKREGEEYGVDYNFISEDEFTLRISQNAFYEYARHGDYLYGTGKYEWENFEVFIMETHGLSKISAEDRKDCFVIFVNTKRDVRTVRLVGRGWDIENISHRNKTDHEKFKDFNDYDLQISSEENYMP
jgi:guanylate kinase